MHRMSQGCQRQLNQSYIAGNAVAEAERAAILDRATCCSGRVFRTYNYCTEEVPHRAGIRGLIRIVPVCLCSLRREIPTEERIYANDYNKRRYADFLQGLGKGSANSVQPRLAAYSGRLGRTDVVLRRARLSSHRS